MENSPDCLCGNSRLRLRTFFYCAQIFWGEIGEFFLFPMDSILETFFGDFCSLARWSSSSVDSVSINNKLFTDRQYQLTSHQSQLSQRQAINVQIIAHWWVSNIFAGVEVQVKKSTTFLITTVNHKKVRTHLVRSSDHLASPNSPSVRVCR